MYSYPDEVYTSQCNVANSRSLHQQVGRPSRCSNDWKLIAFLSSCRRPLRSPTKAAGERASDAPVDRRRANCLIASAFRGRLSPRLSRCPARPHSRRHSELFVDDRRRPDEPTTSPCPRRQRIVDLPPPRNNSPGTCSPAGNIVADICPWLCSEFRVIGLLLTVKVRGF